MKEIDNIINENLKVTEKLTKLNELEAKTKEEFKKAREKVKEGFCYCEKCGEYFRADTFKITQEYGIRNICTFHSLAEFDEDEYEDKNVLIETTECPLGHKTEKILH